MPQEKIKKLEKLRPSIGQLTSKYVLEYCTFGCWRYKLKVIFNLYLSLVLR